MAIIKFTGFWSKQWQLIYSVPKGFLLIKVSDIYKKKLGTALIKLSKNQEKKKALRELDFTFEYFYQKRSIKQNSVMWALYTILAAELNGNMQGSKNQMVTPQSLYEQDLVDFGERSKMLIPKEYLTVFKSQYHIENIRPYKDKVEITVILTTSKMNTLQMAKWIDRLFNRLAEIGVSFKNTAEIANYWIKWRIKLNDEKIILHDEVLTGAEYKNSNPICEATGDYIGQGGGQLCHIQARGMGGNPEEEKDYSSNWLHLCTDAHINTQHKKGWEYFLSKYPWLKYKVETALKRNFPEINEGENIYNTTNKIKDVFDGKEIKENQ